MRQLSDGGTTEETPARPARAREDDWGHRYWPDLRYRTGYSESGRRRIGAIGRETRRTRTSRPNDARTTEGDRPDSRAEAMVT